MLQLLASCLQAFFNETGNAHLCHPFDQLESAPLKSCARIDLAENRFFCSRPGFWPFGQFVSSTLFLQHSNGLSQMAPQQRSTDAQRASRVTEILYFVFICVCPLSRCCCRMLRLSMARFLKFPIVVVHFLTTAAAICELEDHIIIHQ